MVEEARAVISFSSTLPFGSPVGRNNPALLGLCPGDPDVRAILENDYIKNLLSSLLPPVKQSLSDLLKERALDLVTETADLACIGDFQAVNDFARGNIDFTTTVERFFKQADIDLMVGATVTALTNYFTRGALGGYAIPETLAVAKASKFLRKDFPDLCCNFFSKKAGKNTGLNKAPRIQNTKQEVMDYIKGLTEQKNLILNRGKTNDGYHYYEIMRKFVYKGREFKKGEYISRDTRHHEIEHFRDKDYHYGALDPVKGNLKPGSRKPERKLHI